MEKKQRSGPGVLLLAGGAALCLAVVLCLRGTQARAAAAMCSGVVPQQPPTILTPAWTSSAAFCPK